MKVEETSMYMHIQWSPLRRLGFWG